MDESASDVAPTIDQNGNITFATNSRICQINYEGTPNWEKNISDISAHLINDVDGNIYFATYAGDIYCLSNSGVILWKITSPVHTMESLVLLENKLIVWGWNPVSNILIIE